MIDYSEINSNKTGNKIKFLVIFLCTIALILYLSLGMLPHLRDSNKKNINSADLQKEERSVYIGFWTDNFYDLNTKKINPHVMRLIEKKIDKKVAIVNYYHGWEQLGNPLLVDELNDISRQKWIPMISTNPYFFKECISSKNNLYEAIYKGVCDEFIKRAGKNIANYKKPVFIRFAWEMNLDTMDWGIKKTYSTNKDFINAWRRVHEIFNDQGATNIIWVFSPNVDTPNSIDFIELYPGDEYVDWVALDGYNWGETQSWSSWHEFETIFSKSYYKMLKLAPNKKFMIAETNSVSQGGSKADWYRDLLDLEIPTRFTEIDAIIFFNEDKTKEENANWLIDSDKDSLNSLKKYLKKPIYRSSFSNKNVLILQE